VRGVLIGLGVLAAGFLALAIPLPPPSVPEAPERGGGFGWRQDAFWDELERRYVAARAASCDDGSVAAAVEALSSALRDLPDTIAPRSVHMDTLETSLFTVGALVAACPAALDGYLQVTADLRRVIKRRSRQWRVNDPAVRDRLYRALYGGRAAAEEVMLQHPDRLVPLVTGVDEPSSTPSAVVRGVRIHSGDLLVSRGGYPTSALIARGNDYPGNFSHIALVHVDSATHEVSVIEAHIARGVAIGTAEQYLNDKKLRMMVLRPRADLPQLMADPLLPHRAATLSLQRARTEHIPYDFEMDYDDPQKLFCSEVASSVYRQLGVPLWTGLSTISAEGLRRWLASFGVRHFETQEPSDLEYDPQLVVVAEWRDPESLRRDHIDNATIDAMLEGANRGDKLSFSWYHLPLARAAKAYSWVVRRFGAYGPIPEGMTPTAALRSQAFSARQLRMADDVDGRARTLEAEQGYPPPYWVLLELARAARDQLPATSVPGIDSAVAPVRSP